MNVIKKLKKLFLQEQNILQEILISANFTFKKTKNKKKQPQSPDRHYNNKRNLSHLTDITPH